MPRTRPVNKWAQLGRDLWDLFCAIDQWLLALLRCVWRSVTHGLTCKEVDE